MGFGWKLTISFFLLFLIGALCGVALTLTFGVSHPAAQSVQIPRSWEDNALRNLTNHLKLDPGQQSQVRAVIHDAIARIRMTQREHQLEGITLFDKALQTLYPLLNNEQQHQLDLFREHRREALLKKFAKSSP
jgi:23S rRNA U2552 (ribose-2'-O)-methylase RlmE/FtsJ